MNFQDLLEDIKTREDYHKAFQKLDTVEVFLKNKKLGYIPETRIIGWRENGAAIHQLQKNVCFWLDDGYAIYIPAGFIFDGASIPKVAWSIVGAADGRYFLAALVHDWLYTTKQLSKEQADNLFKRVMMKIGIGWWKRMIMWRAVDWFGGSPWRTEDRDISLWMYPEGFKYSPFGEYASRTEKENTSFNLVPPKAIETNFYKEFYKICINRTKK